ncbi:MAG TPA: hypothetical protein VGF30_13040, partial [Bacteroidia bacterium]
LFAEGTFYFGKSFYTTLHVGYGGYGKLSGGLSVNVNIKDHFSAKLGSNYIQGYIIPKNSLGQGAYFSLSYKF